MPNVGGKEFPYTPEGVADAGAAEGGGGPPMPPQGGGDTTQLMMTLVKALQSLPPSMLVQVFRMAMEGKGGPMSAGGPAPGGPMGGPGGIKSEAAAGMMAPGGGGGVLG